MGKLIKFAAKNPSDVAVPIAANADGAIFVSRVWETKVVNIHNITSFSGTSYVPTEYVDSSEWGVVSLRILNSTDKTITISPRTDTYTDGGHKFKLLSDTANQFKFDVPAGYWVVTPDDFPFLNYMTLLNLYVLTNEAPTTGKIQVDVVLKR